MNAQPFSTLIFTIVGGIFSIVLAEKTKLPSIIYLLIFGVLLGPEFANLIQPHIFQENFPHYISILVALILFEGGASLKFSQLREISNAVRNLLTVGVLTTLIVFSLCAHFVAGFSWSQSLLLASLMVVTGPTVVIPILRRLRIRENLHNILKWEAILIDPLGVIIAVVLFEFLLFEGVGILEGVVFFVGRILLGLALGLAGGWITFQAFNKKWLLRHEGGDLGGLFLVGFVVLFYGISEWILSHSGLVTVTVAGIYAGNRKFAFQDQIFHFKKQVTFFALSVLFILLASNIPVRASRGILLEGSILLFLLIVLVRPLSVFLSTFRQNKLSFKEKLFIGSVAPRGIVSASLASLFAIAFEERALTGTGRFLPLAFFLIAGSVVFYAIISAVAAKILQVHEAKGNGILIAGANPLGLLFGEVLRERKIPALFIDTNPFACRTARQKGFAAFEGSAFDRDFLESLDLKGLVSMLALTPNHEVNVLSCQTFALYLGRNQVFRLWDKTDDWKTVTAHAYDESWGRPLMISSGFSEKDFWDQIHSGCYLAKNKTLTAPLKITPENLAQANLGLPLFAFKQKMLFFIPQADIPEGSQVYYLQRED